MASEPYRYGSGQVLLDWTRDKTPESPSKRLSQIPSCTSKSVPLDTIIKAEDVSRTYNDSDIFAAPKISWQGCPGLKAVLVYMQLAYDISWTDMSPIFWELFRFQLISFKLMPDQDISRKLNSQWTDIKIKSSPSANIPVPKVSLRQIQDFCTYVEKKVTGAAQSCGIKLKHKTTSSTRLYTLIGQHSNALPFSFPSLPTFEVEPDEAEDCLALSIPISSIRNAPTSKSQPSNQKKHAVISPQSFHTSENIPPLVFRAWNSRSHGLNSVNKFIAALFNNPGVIVPLAPHPDDPAILDNAEKHLYSKSFDGPFISVTSSLIWALHKALAMRRSSCGDVYMSIMSGSSTNRRSGTYYSKNLIYQLRQQNRIPSHGYSYKGRFEYLVWGEIDAPSIRSVISVERLRCLALQDEDVSNFIQFPILDSGQKMSTIRSHMACHTATESTGRAIGKLIQLVLERSQTTDFSRANPDIRELIQVLLQNWQVARDSRNWEEQTELVRGIDDGLGMIPYSATNSTETRPTSTATQLLRSFAPQTPQRLFKLSSHQNSLIGGLMTPSPTPHKIPQSNARMTADGEPPQETSPTSQKVSRILSFESDNQATQRDSRIFEIIEITSDSEPEEDDNDDYQPGADVECNNDDTSSDYPSTDSDTDVESNDGGVSMLDTDHDDDYFDDDGDDASVLFYDDGLDYPCAGDDEIKDEQSDPADKFQDVMHLDTALPQQSITADDGGAVNEIELDDVDSNMEDVDSCMDDVSFELTLDGVSIDQGNDGDTETEPKTRSKMVIRNGLVSFSPYP